MRDRRECFYCHRMGHLVGDRRTSNSDPGGRQEIPKTQDHRVVLFHSTPRCNSAPQWGQAQGGSQVPHHPSRNGLMGQVHGRVSSNNQQEPVPDISERTSVTRTARKSDSVG